MTRSRAVGLGALVFLVALNLRPSLTSVGPLLPRIGADEGLSEGVRGVLGALPLLAFGLVSPLVYRVSGRLGVERSVLVALVLLVVGVVIRSYAGTVGLWGGTVVLGSAIAVGNVLVPAIVKRDFSSHVSRATGVYSACLTVAASVASAVAIPLAGTAGWRNSLAFWALPAAVVAVLWLPRVRAGAAVVAEAGVRVALWRHRAAWLVTAFMGLQSTTFYIMVTWLPSIETASGISEARAGVHLFGYQLAGIAAGLTIPRLMRRPDNQVAAALTASTPMLIGVLGLLFVPSLTLLWVVIAGLGTGASLVVALTLISLRGRTHQETTQLSGMAQSLGYLLAATGPVLAGYLAEATHAWRAPLVLIGVLAIAQLAVAVPVGRTKQPSTSG